MTRAEVKEEGVRIMVELWARGYPMLGVHELDGGAKFGFAIRLRNGGFHGFRVPLEYLSVGTVAAMVEAYL